VTATGDIEAALHGASMVLLAVPSHAARETLIAMSPLLDEDAIIVSVAKGIEIETGKRISEIAKEVVLAFAPVCLLSGPSFAKEVVAKDIRQQSLPPAKTICTARAFRTI
jgi:glycerol-3-phosphate dehydrogenase (NAD(P)+)